MCRARKLLDPRPHSPLSWIAVRHHADRNPDCVPLRLRYAHELQHSRNQSTRRRRVVVLARPVLGKEVDRLRCWIVETRVDGEAAGSWWRAMRSTECGPNLRSTAKNASGVISQSLGSGRRRLVAPIWTALAALDLAAAAPSGVPERPLRPPCPLQRFGQPIDRPHRATTRSRLGSPRPTVPRLKTEQRHCEVMATRSDSSCTRSLASSARYSRRCAWEKA